MRYNELRASPADAKYKLCVVQFKVPGAKNGGSDKGPDGNRIDSIPCVSWSRSRDLWVAPRLAFLPLPALLLLIRTWPSRHRPPQRARRRGRSRR